MILKKPYAFLIKHFKLIHLLLCLPMIYLLLKSRDIANFFSLYIENSYYTNVVNIASTYINYLMYLAIIIVLLVAIAIYFLMRQKEKNTKYYFLVMAFYVILFILVSVCYSALNSIEEATVSSQSARLFRDISYIAYIPQYFFLGYTVLRGIGFNLKQFNFDIDVMELEISDVDSEEFEVQFGKDFYKYKRGFRRFIREIRYYFLENKVAFFFFASVIVIALGTIIYLNFGVYHKTYKQTQRISHNGLIVSVVSSELSNMDLSGKVISDKYYMAVGLKIINRGNTKVRLDYENFKLLYDKEYLMATLDRGIYFTDLGIPYTRDMEIAPNTENTYVLTYEIDPSIVNKNFELRILESLESTMVGITPIYKEVKLKYEKHDERKDVNTLALGKILELSSTRLGFTQLQIKNYDITNKYVYDYEKCSGSYCSNLKGVITVNPEKYGSNKSLLVLNRMFSLDKTTPYYMSRKVDSSFISDFLKVRYQIGEKTSESKVYDLTAKELNGMWVLVVPSDVINASKLDLLVNIREKVFVLNLK